MPGRYSIGASAEKIAERFNVTAPSEGYEARYNAAPTQLLPIIANSSPKGISYFYWGTIPGWSKNKSISPKLINAPTETLKEKATFKNALKKRRCLIPADGFYEWKRISKKGKVPYRIVMNSKDIFSFAGLWEEFEDENEKTVHTFTIITTTANATLRPIHNRMPAILDQENEQKWLKESTTEEDLLSMLKPYPSDKMSSYTVSHRINQVANEGISLIQPCAPVDQFGNYSLFD